MGVFLALRKRVYKVACYSDEMFMSSRMQMYYQLSKQDIFFRQNFRRIRQKYIVLIGNAPVTQSCKMYSSINRTELVSHAVKAWTVQFASSSTV